MSAKEFIPIDDLFADSAEYRNRHSKFLAIILSTSAIISTISSSILIRMISRSPSRLTTTYHRVLLGMTISDILYSLSNVTFGALIPSDMSYVVWNARGNQATCNVQGFLFVVGGALTLLYSCSLNIYSLAIVKYNKTDSYIREKMEPFLHGVPIAFSFAIGIGLLAARGYNSDSRMTCIAPTYGPDHCDGYEDGQVREGFDIPCGRGRDGPAAPIFFVGFFVLTFGTPIVVVVTLAMMFKDVSQQERRISRYGAGSLNRSAPQQNTDASAAAAAGGGSGRCSRINAAVSSLKSRFGRLSNRSNPNQDNSMSRGVLHRALAYSIAYFLTWTWAIVRVALLLAGVPRPFPLRYLISIFTPLQGFWNLIIFIQPKVIQAKKSQGGNLSWCQAFAKAFGFTVGGKKNTRNSVTQENPDVEEQKTEIQANQQGDI